MTQNRFSLRSIFLTVALAAVGVAISSGNTYTLAVLFVVAAVIAVLGLPVLILVFLIAQPLRIRGTQGKSNAREQDA